MDFSHVTKPVAAAPVATAQRPDPASTARPVAATQLGPDRAVAQIQEDDPVRLQMSPGAGDRAALEEAMRRVIERTIEVDGKTKAVVYRATDESTGEVVDQIPTEQVLKLRAYLRDQTDAAAKG